MGVVHHGPQRDKGKNVSSELAVQVVAFAWQGQALQIKTVPTGTCEVATWEAASRFRHPHANRDVVHTLARSFRNFHKNGTSHEV